MSKLYRGYYQSQIDVLEVCGTEKGIVSITFVDKPGEVSELNSCVEECLQQLDEYFKGTRKEFTLQVNPQGTEFQNKVWRALLDIPYSETRSYFEIAKAIGNEKSVRAVGSANSRNKIPIILPCHRVIGKNGALTGYAGELWRKEWLLKHEKGI